MTSGVARAFWIAAPGSGEVRDEVIAPPRDGEVLVRALYSGVSRGTEALVFEGRVPPTEWDRMRAPFQVGSFPAPVKYGYASVGVVEAGPLDLVDRQVFVLFPHQTRYCVPAAAAYPLPEDVPPARAVLTANMETAVNGVWDAQPNLGDRVVVVGAGVVGCLMAWLIGRIPGTEVTLVDINPARRAIASALGVGFVQPDALSGEADLVVHASGTPDGLAQALRVAAFEATVLEMSWYGDRHVTVPLGESFHARRLTLRSSQVGHVAGPQRARWGHGRRMALALSLLRDPALDVLVSGDSPFEELPTLMPRLAAASSGTLCHRIHY